ncbi:hypothetical protein RJ639_031779 [Escallonia herrerae]|uniref:Retrotransposon gag domain-containing protein n=1 Tax=Escallonia herrerae TaxID=1293975 RepID=A0AA88WZC0_9ASTE|nr:hypothetical protein RJ639_031779 [Escallonia herrerae]
MGYTDKEKKKFTFYKLDGKASHWWKIIEDSEMVEQYKAMTEDHFKVLFFDPYFPRSVKEQMYHDFLSMRQEKNESFTELRQHIVPVPIETYVQYVDIAKITESQTRDYRERKDARAGKKDSPELCPHGLSPRDQDPNQFVAVDLAHLSSRLSSPAHLQSPLAGPSSRLLSSRCAASAVCTTTPLLPVPFAAAAPQVYLKSWVVGMILLFLLFPYHPLIRNVMCCDCELAVA